jgi:hypothetical protein
MPTPNLADLDLGELEAQITELSAHLNAATYRWLLLIGEFDRRLGWNDGALHSCAHWLNFKCGLNLGAAREKVRVAHALPGLPKIAAAMERGQLSYSKVRALTRVAVPATEESLLMIARHGTAHHVEKLVRHYRRYQDADQLSRDARQQAERCFSSFYDEDGSLVFRGRLPALAGAMLLKAIEVGIERLPEISADGTDAEAPAQWPERRADALALIAETFLEHPKRGVATADRYQIVVHVDAETLSSGAAGRCEIEEGPGLAAETARRLACDSSIVMIKETVNGAPLEIGRKTRSIPPAIRRALRSRDRGCRFPGCTHSRYLDAHHVEHWAHGGETDLTNLLSLCRFHHRRVHEDGITVERCAKNEYRFVRADGRVLDGGPFDEVDVPWHGIWRYTAERGITIHATTATPLWGGERMDYGLALSGLYHQANRAHDISAATPWVDPAEDTSNPF